MSVATQYTHHVRHDPVMQARRLHSASQQMPHAHVYRKAFIPSRARQAAACLVEQICNLSQAEILLSCIRMQFTQIAVAVITCHVPPHEHMNCHIQDAAYSVAPQHKLAVMTLLVLDPLSHDQAGPQAPGPAHTPFLTIALSSPTGHGSCISR